MNKIKALQYCLFPGLLFSTIWITFAIALGLAVWEITLGFLLVEAIAWLGGNES